MVSWEQALAEGHAPSAHMGIGQPLIVAGRTAKLGNGAKGRVECCQHQLFTAGQAVQQRDGKGVAFDRRESGIPAGRKQAVACGLEPPPCCCAAPRRASPSTPPPSSPQPCRRTASNIASPGSATGCTALCRAARCAPPSRSGTTFPTPWYRATRILGRTRGSKCGR